MRQFGERVIGVAYRDRPGAYGIIGDGHGLIAVMHTPSGHHLPGGGQDAGESLEETLHREVLEETGCTVVIGERLMIAAQYCYAAEYGQYFNKVEHFFSGWIGARQCPPRETDHHLLWVSPEEALSLLAHDCQIWAVAEVFGR